MFEMNETVHFMSSPFLNGIGKIVGINISNFGVKYKIKFYDFTSKQSKTEYFDEFNIERLKNYEEFC